MARKQLEQFSMQIQRETIRTRMQMETRRQAAAEQARLHAEQTRIKAEETRLAQEALRAQQLAAIQANIDKQKAWKEFYKPTVGCETSNQNRDILKCGNDHARAKKKFEDMWASPPVTRYP